MRRLESNEMYRGNTRTLNCLCGMRRAQHPSLVEREEKLISRLVPPIIAVCVLSATAMKLPLVALAQSTEQGAAQIASALNLEDLATAPGLPRLTVTNASGGVAHIFPTVRAAVLRSRAVQTSPLLYHSGGPVMSTAAIYSIFWVPPYLQNGASTSLSASYRSLMTRLAGDYPAHGIDNNNTEYFQIVGTTKTYIQNVGSNAGFYVDSSLLPASGCSDSATPGNCITDAEIRSEIQKVMTRQGWTGGLNHIFMLYTSSGEGSCFDLRSTSCAYVQYCAYHSFISASPPVIYGNIPYGNTSVCQLQGTPSPNGFPAADAAMTSSSHEISESITDPLLNAWFTSGGFEIGDLCAYDYGTNAWDSGNANQAWNGNFYELQTEFDNHAFNLGFAGCVQVGPFGQPPG
jgi:hypothetical protein